MNLPAWASRRHRALHLTIRDIDCRDFDVGAMIETFRRWHVTLFSFFAGGYITTYPSRLPWQKASSHLRGRDLCGEILAAAREAGMVAFPMIDLGEVPIEVARQHPDWVARKADGSFFTKSDGIVTACPLGDYIRVCSRDLVAELLERYPIDGIKFGGASYGFPPGVCHCDRCRNTYRNEAGRDLPADRNDPTYETWREKTMRQTVRHLVEVVHGVAEIPVVGNSVWHLGRGMDIEDLAKDQDFIQVEVQTRLFLNGEDAEPLWERLTFPTETTRYMSGLTARAPWVVASYFIAWPWRRVAVPAAEQKVYLAQIAANGGSPMVNLSGGPPAVHEDPRGFRAIEELYGFMARHADLYEGDRSAAAVALVFSQETARWAQRADELERLYLSELHGCQEILDRQHIPYDILSTTQLPSIPAGRYDAFVLPGAICLDEAAGAALVAAVRRGTGLVATGAPGATRETGEWRGLTPLLQLLGARAIEQPGQLLTSPHIGPAQGYGRLHGPHPLLEGIGAGLAAVAGSWWPIQASPDAAVPVRRAAPFRLFPEGLSFPDGDDPAEPLAVARETSAGRTVLFPFLVGRTARRSGHPDADLLFGNAVRWATRDRLPVRLDGHAGVLLSLRRNGDRSLLHAINLNCTRRFFQEPTPARDLRFRFRTERAPARVWSAATGADLSAQTIEGGVEVSLPELVDYDIVVLE